MLKRLTAVLVALIMLISTASFAAPSQTSIQNQTLGHLSTYMNRYDKTKFNAVAKVGNFNIYKATLMDVSIVVDSKMKAKAMYDSDSNKLTLQKHPAKISKTESLSYGESIWHELTHKIENQQDELGALEGQAYAEKNTKYMAYVIGTALPVLQKMELDKKADSTKIAKYWDLFIKKMDEASAIPEVKQYPPDNETLQSWFGFKVSSDEILNYYLKGSAGTAIKTALAGKVQTNWAGTWETEFGLLTLKQSGSKVTGEYEYGDGTLSGSIAGNKLTGTWKENDDEGTFTFVIDSTNNSFKGIWKETKPDPSQGGAWDGEKAKPGVVTQPTTQPPSQPEPQVLPEPLADWSGTWDTDYGTMTLKQVGNQITGSYEHQGGTVTGIASGYTFTGNWKESDDEGTMTFTIATDGQSFTGTWVETSPTPSQPSGWNGIRPQEPVVAPAPVVPQYDWSGVWVTDFGKMTITQNGDQITGKYDYQDGVVTGTINGSSLIGNWKESDDEGTFNFVLSEDQKSFTGTWKETSPNPSSGGAWNGHR